MEKFEEWLRTVCFQKPTNEAYDLAKCAWKRATEWQPITTAPKDGTVVDLWHKIGIRIVDVWWDESDNCWSCALDDDDFTHWMLIPKAPEQNNTTGELDGLATD